MLPPAEKAPPGAAKRRQRRAARGRLRPLLCWLKRIQAMYRTPCPTDEPWALVDPVEMGGAGCAHIGMPLS